MVSCVIFIVNCLLEGKLIIVFWLFIDDYMVDVDFLELLLLLFFRMFMNCVFQEENGLYLFSLGDVIGMEGCLLQKIVIVELICMQQEFF